MSGFDFMNSGATDETEAPAPAPAAFDFMGGGAAPAPAGDTPAPIAFDFMGGGGAAPEAAGAIDLTALGGGGGAEAAEPAVGGDAIGLDMLGLGDPAPAPASDAPAAIDLSAFDMGAPAPAPAPDAGGGIDLASLSMEMPAPAPAPPPVMAGGLDLSAFDAPPAAAGSIDLAALGVEAAPAAAAPAPVTRKKKKKGFKLGAAAIDAREAKASAATEGAAAAPAPAAPAAFGAPAPAPAPAPASGFGFAATPSAMDQPMPAAVAAAVPMRPAKAKSPKKALSLDDQIKEKHKKVKTFIEAQIKIQDETNKLTQEVEEKRVQLTQQEELLEAAISAEDFAGSGEIQQRIDTYGAMLRKKQADISKNQARYAKGEAAKHKQINSIVELRSKLLEQTVTQRKQVVEAAQAELASCLDKLEKGETMMKDMQSQIDASTKEVAEATEILNAKVAIVEQKVAEGTAPEQEKKTVQTDILSGIDVDIAELERQLALKREERAGVVETIETIEVAIQVERDKFADEYAVLNAERERLGGVSHETAQQTETLASRSVQLESFRAESTTTRQEHLQQLQAFAVKEDEQHKAIASLKFYIEENVAIAAKKEERDLGEAPINEELETVKATLAQFTATNQEFATAMLESQRILSQLKRDVESAEREIPELEAQKKLAVQARNFDEAQRVSEQVKQLTANKEANEAKKSTVQAEISTKEAANAEALAQLKALQDSVAMKEKELQSYKYATLCGQIASMKGLRKMAEEDGDDAAAGLLQVQMETQGRVAEGLTLKYGLGGNVADIEPTMPTRPVTT